MVADNPNYKIPPPIKDGCKSMKSKTPKCFGQVPLITDSRKCAHCELFGRCMSVIKTKVSRKWQKPSVSEI